MECEGQGRLGAPEIEFEAPFGRFAITVGPWTRPTVEAPEGFLEAAGNLCGSYTLEDRTVYVFERLTMEVFRNGGLYSFHID